MENLWHVEPVATVVGGRSDPFDDDWNVERAIIRLDADRFGPESLAGLSDFSHLEVVFLFHLVGPDDIHVGARHPRSNPDWPLVGIGVSRCRLLAVDGLDVHVAGLDAIAGSPVLDVKPFMAEFGPVGETTQPEWATELMRDYY